MALEAGGQELLTKTGRRPAVELNYSGAPASQWRLVVALTVITMLSAIDRQGLALLVEPIKADLSLTDGQMGLLMGAAMAVTGLVVGPPAGFLADRMCRRCMIGFSAVAWSLLTGLCGLASGFVQLLAARCGVGVFEGVAAPATASMLRDALSPERRGRGFAIFAMAPLIGTGLAMLAGGGLVAAVTALRIHQLPLVGEVHPWQLVFLAFALVGLPGAALMLMVREPARVDHETTAGDATLGEALRHLKAHWGVYLPLIAFATLHAMLGLSFAAWAPALLARTWGLSPAQIGVTFGVLMLVMAPLGLLAAGFAIDRPNGPRTRDPAMVGIVATVIIWLAATAMPIAPTPLLFWLCFAVLLFVSGTATPVASTIMASVTPSRVMGKLVAVQGLVVGVCSATIAPSLPPLLAGTLFRGDARALGEALSLAVFAYGLLALVAAFILQRARRRAA